LPEAVSSLSGILELAATLAIDSVVFNFDVNFWGSEQVAKKLAKDIEKDKNDIRRRYVTYRKLLQHAAKLRIPCAFIMPIYKVLPMHGY
jgi:hypothetical protein